MTQHEEKPEAVVIFHSHNGKDAHCDDGFAAAWIAVKALNHPKLIPAVYGHEPPIEECRGKAVYVLDFSYKRAKMAELVNGAAYTYVFDHHESAERELDNFVATPELHGNVCAEINFDKTKSGAMMTWNKFFPDVDPPPLIKHIQDYDLWQWRMHMTKEAKAALNSYAQTLATWNWLMQRPIEELYTEGAAIRRYIDQKISLLLQDAWLAGLLEHKVYMANAPQFFSSELGHELAKISPSGIGIVFTEYKEFYKYSLRGSNEAPAVNKIAETFGGGGHRNAAGFILPKDKKL